MGRRHCSGCLLHVAAHRILSASHPPHRPESLAADAALHFVGMARKDRDAAVCEGDDYADGEAVAVQKDRVGE